MCRQSHSQDPCLTDAVGFFYPKADRNWEFLHSRWKKKTKTKLDLYQDLKPGMPGNSYSVKFNFVAKYFAYFIIIWKKCIIVAVFQVV